MDAEVTRVVDGKTPRWLAKICESRRGRWKDAAMVGEDLRIADQPRQARGEFGRNHVGPEAIADDEHGSLHVMLPHS